LELVPEESFYKYIGIPFVDRGRNMTGCDCWGLFRLVYRELKGIELPEYLLSSCHALNELSPAVEESRQVWEPIKEPESMCLIAFSIGTFVTGLVTHIGTYIGANKFLHTIAKKKMSQIERLSHPFYQRKIEGFYKYAGQHPYNSGEKPV